MAKYLIFKTGALGDLSFLLPAVEQIHRFDPQAEITWIVGKTYLPILEKNPQIHRIIGLDERKLFHGSLLERAAQVFSLWRQLDFHYDQIWMGHRTGSAFFLVRLRVLGKVYQVVRKNSQMLRFWRNEVVIPPLKHHESLAFKQLTEKALNHSISRTEWVKTSSSWISPYSFPKPYWVLHIGGGSNSKTEFQLKKWPHWKALLNRIIQVTSAQILLIGSPEEKEEAEEITVSQPEFQNRVTSLVGKTTLIDLLSVVKSAQFLIGVDSGPLHWADYFGVACIGLYGPTSLISWGLLGRNSKNLSHSEPCSPCYQDDGFFPECPYSVKCMTHLEIDSVMEQIPPSMLV